MPAGQDRPEPWPTDPGSAAARLMVVIVEIDTRDLDDHDVLLADLLKVAWPTCWTQDQ